MLIALASPEVLDAARAAAIALLEARLHHVSLPDDPEQDPLLVDFALEQATPPDLYRFASSAGKLGGESIDRRIRVCVMLRYRRAVAKALAEQYAPLNRPPSEFQALAKTAVDAMVSRGGPAAVPSPALVAQIIAASRPFKHTDADGRLNEVWCLNGKYHRDPAEGPAVLIAGPGFERAEFFVHGELHRPTKDGPAVEERQHGKVVLYQYRIDGNPHRPVSQGPAEVLDMYGVYWEEYAEHGQRHRPPTEGPAFSCYEDNPSSPAFHVQYTTHGELHRNPADGPAEINHYGDRLDMAYCVEGVLLYKATEVFPC